MTELKQLCNDFHHNLLQNYILFKNFSYLDELNIELPNLKYTDIALEKLPRLFTIIKTNLEEEKIFENKINEINYLNSYYLFEGFFYDFCRQYYLLNKEKLPLKEFPEKFNIKPCDLLTQKSIDEKWSELIESHLRKKGYKNLSSVVFSFLKEILGLTNKDIPFYQDILKEVTLARNCLVHNNGEISKEYMTLNEKYIKHTDGVIITSEVIDEQIDIFLKLSSLIRESI